MIKDLSLEHKQNMEEFALISLPFSSLDYHILFGYFPH